MSGLTIEPKHAWMTTRSGRRFQPFDPEPSTIVIEDIAWALANQCRFNGHVSQFYSVAQHSVAVSRLVSPARRSLKNNNRPMTINRVPSF